MKRLVIVSALFAICLAVSVYTVHYVELVTDQVYLGVDSAKKALADSDSDALIRHIDALSEYWDKKEEHLLHLIRHSQIDDITKSIARLRSLAQWEHYPELAAELDSIRWQMEQIDHSERLILSNIL